MISASWETSRTNRTLLDWLASEFVAQRLERQGDRSADRTSSAYRQSSAPDVAKAKVDPDNRLFWRMNRKRFDAEMIRDAALSVSGTLNPQMGAVPCAFRSSRKFTI